MKRSRFTEQEITEILKKPGESGTPVVEVCRQSGISEATFYNWRKKYGAANGSERRHLEKVRPVSLDPVEARRLKLLEDDNRRLKRMVVDLLLDKARLQEEVAKKV